MKQETQIKTVNHGIKSPVAKADAIHGEFNKNTGELISFSATDISCAADYTSDLSKAEQELCKKELIQSYNCHVKTA